VAVGMSGMLVMIVVMFMPPRVPGHVLNLDLHVLAAGVAGGAGEAPSPALSKMDGA